jgi:hypothetical protein
MESQVISFQEAVGECATRKGDAGGGGGGRMEGGIAPRVVTRVMARVHWRVLLEKAGEEEY